MSEEWRCTRPGCSYSNSSARSRCFRCYAHKPSTNPTRRQRSGALSAGLAAPCPSFCRCTTEHHSAPSKARTAPSGSERCADATVRCTDATDGCTSLSWPLADPSTHRSDPSIRLTHPYAPSEPRAQPAERRTDPSAISAAPSEGLTDPDGSARDADSSRPAPKPSRGGTRPSELRLDSCAPRTHPSSRVTPRSHRCTHPYEKCECLSHLGRAPVDLGSPPSPELVRSAPSDQKLGSSGSTSAERDPLDDGAGVLPRNHPPPRPLEQTVHAVKSTPEHQRSTSPCKVMPPPLPPSAPSAAPMASCPPTPSLSHHPQAGSPVTSHPTPLGTEQNVLNHAPPQPQVTCNSVSNHPPLHSTRQSVCNHPSSSGQNVLNQPSPQGMGESVLNHRPLQGIRQSVSNQPPPGTGQSVYYQRAAAAMARRGSVDVLRGRDDTTPTAHRISFGREQMEGAGARREGWQGASDLTQPQRAAACHSPSAALVVYAPAGAGKTLTLVRSSAPPLPTSLHSPSSPSRWAPGETLFD